MCFFLLFYYYYYYFVPIERRNPQNNNNITARRPRRQTTACDVWLRELRGTAAYVPNILISYHNMCFIWILSAPLGRLADAPCRLTWTKSKFIFSRMPGSPRAFTVRNRLIYKDSFEEGPLSRVAAEQFSTVVSRWASEEEACVEESTAKTPYSIIIL